MKSKYYILALFLLIVWNSIYALESSEISLKYLKKQAKLTKSDEICVLKNGKEIFYYSSGKHKEPIVIMSVTKSIVALAIGLAIDDGFIRSIDTPVYKFYPEWKNGDKSIITIRNLLNHTSGIQADKRTEKIYKSPDFIQLALKSKLSDKPGTRFFYNNKAVNILPGIIEKATGKRMDIYLEQRLFKKLGIPRNNWGWLQDKSGHPQGMGGLMIKARSLAKIGQLILQNGLWQEKRIISQNWIDKMLGPGQKINPSCGFLWWRKSLPKTDKLFYSDKIIMNYKKAKIPDKFLKKLESIRNIKFTRTEWKNTLRKLFETKKEIEEFQTSVRAAKLPLAEWEQGSIIMYYGEGYLGQYLVIIPGKKIVGVRLIHYKSASSNTEFHDFANILLKL